MQLCGKSHMFLRMQRIASGQRRHIVRLLLLTSSTLLASFGRSRPLLAARGFAGPLVHSCQPARHISACQATSRQGEQRVLLGSRGSIAVPLIAEAIASESRNFQIVYIGTAKTAPRSDSDRPLKDQRKKRRWEARRKAKDFSEILNNAPHTSIFMEDYHGKPDELAEAIAAGFSTAEAEAEPPTRLLIVDGGNTYWLWYHAQQAQFLQVLEMVQASHPFTYVGLSAGAILAGTTCRTADWKGWDDPSVVPSGGLTAAMEGLGLVDSAVFPHHAQEWEQLVEDRRGSLPADSGLICVGDEDVLEHAWKRR